MITVESRPVVLDIKNFYSVEDELGEVHNFSQQPGLRFWGKPIQDRIPINDLITEAAQSHIHSGSASLALDNT